MTSAVLDASAVLALIRDEPGGEKVAGHIGHAAISAVTLQEVIEELLLSGLDVPTTRELLDELRLDIRAHDVEAAYAAAGLHAPTRDHGPRNRACLALALHLNVPVLTADTGWRHVTIANLWIEPIR